jgi:hypothetical protein
VGRVKFQIQEPMYQPSTTISGFQHFSPVLVKSWNIPLKRSINSVVSAINRCCSTEATFAVVPDALFLSWVVRIIYLIIANLPPPS